MSIWRQNFREVIQKNQRVEQIINQFLTHQLKTGFKGSFDDEDSQNKL